MTNDELFDIACKARLNAKVDISNYMVGAALLCENGNVYMGCNVEMKEIPNLSCCAERVAFQNAISNGERNFEKILVVGGERDRELVTTYPCGVCRQYMIEMNKNIKIVVRDGDDYKECTLVDLMMHSFVLDEQYKK